MCVSHKLFLSKDREAGGVGLEAEQVLSTGMRGEGEFTVFPVALGHQHLQTSHTPHRQVTTFINVLKHI